MSRAAYLVALRRELSRVDEKIREAEGAENRGRPYEMVHAQGDLVLLRRRRMALVDKIARLESGSDGLFSALRAEIDQDISSLLEAVDRFIARHDKSQLSGTVPRKRLH